MGSKQRLAIFNVLGDITGLTTLDLFAGTGALGLEALSRGAAHATFVENNASAHLCIDKNIQSLKVESETSNLLSDASLYVSNCTEKFNIIFVDPPYTHAKNFNVNAITEIVPPGGVVVLSLPKDVPLPDFTAITLVKSISYTNAQIYFYKDNG